ncbi:MULTISPECIES: tripartite tricarboxylate transporter substrate-binding protein [Delftia]|uniref:Tripartite tricarboxylate transporter substrate-binding protein n=1 Tax=Delftia deserti TaxID=1651218 RepID=A0ABW5EU33_9BURK|nr:MULTISPECIES: tripartite tricarboxylate transporter substrate-binding protein [Delftia]MBB1653524.1 hypothetical protein [Delftia sp. UME58]
MLHEPVVGHAGRIDMYMGSVPTLLSHIQSGKVRAIGVTTASRSKLLPDVPTCTESASRAWSWPACGA